MRLFAYAAAGVTLAACGATAEVVLGTGDDPGGGGGAGGDGSRGSGGFMSFPTATGGAGVCASVTRIAESVAVDAQVLLDASGAMDEPLPLPDAGTRWSATRDAFVRFAADPMISPHGLGLQLFPRDGRTACDLGPTLPILFSYSGPHGARMAPRVENITPAGPTTFASALRGVLELMSQLRDALGPRVRHAIAVTGGTPETCEPGDLAELATIAGQQHEVDAVRTHIIGVNLGDAASALDPIAEAGGTLAVVRIEGGDVSQQIYAAMRAALGTDYVCEYAIPLSSPDGVQWPLSRVTVTATNATGDKSVIPRAASAEDCEGETGSGWYGKPEAVVDGQSVLVLCPRTCADASNGKLRFDLGCGPSMGQ